MQDGDHISVRDAIERVGRLRYAKDWIGDLTQREHWLLSRYRPKPSRRVWRESILPGCSGWFIEELSGDDPPSEALGKEVACAWDRRDWMAVQKQEVNRLLAAAHLYPGHSESIDRELFEKLVRRTFGAPTAPATGLLSKADIQRLVAEYMALARPHSQMDFEAWVRGEKHHSGHRSHLRNGFNKYSALKIRRGRKRRSPNSPV
jgi:hypothetical protein